MPINQSSPYFGFCCKCLIPLPTEDPDTFNFKGELIESRGAPSIGQSGEWGILKPLTREKEALLGMDGCYSLDCPKWVCTFCVDLASAQEALRLLEQEETKYDADFMDVIDTRLKFAKWRNLAPLWHTAKLDMVIANMAVKIRRIEYIIERNELIPR